jgi:hypothetical protein
VKLSAIAQNARLLAKLTKKILGMTLNCIIKKVKTVFINGQAFKTNN